MSQVINTNVLSLTAQRNLQTSQSELATSLQRLSSGLRINSAKDDAAGLAISERFTTQIRGLNQAIRNANDGISLSQTGEAALATVTDNLQRIRELAVQSVNATNSDTDRATLQQEVQQRLSEIDRIAGQTSFNGRNVLDGTFGEAQFQVGANVGQTISLNLSEGASVRSGDMGSIATATSADLGTLINPAGTPASATFDLSTLLGTDYSAAATASTATVAATALQGDFSTTPASATLAFGADTGDAIAANDTVVLNGVTFTFQDSTNPSVVVDSTNVTVNFDLTNATGDTNELAVAELAAAIDLAATDGADTASALANLSAAPDGTTASTLTVTDTTGNDAVTISSLTTSILAATTDPTASITAETDAQVEFTLTDGTNTDTFTLNTDLSSATASDLESAISSQLSAFGVEVSGTDLVFTASTAGATSAAPTLTAAEDPDGDSTTGPLNGTITVSADSQGAAADSIDLVIGDPGDGSVTITLAADLSAGTTEQQSAALLDAIESGLAATPQFSASEDGAGNITLTDVVDSSGSFGTGSFSFSVDGGSTTETATSTTAGDATPVELTTAGLTIQFGENSAIEVADGTYSTVQSFVDAVNTALGSNGSALLNADNELTITSGENVTIAGDGTTAATQVFGGTTEFTVDDTKSLSDTSVTTVDKANEAIARIDAALSSVSELRSTFGAIQNRFESTIENLTTTSENLSASRSRILDADFAAETANLTRVQILQQAGISVLSQANVAPQNVLALLQ